MTTAAQVKKLVRSLLERHEDLALVGRWIFVKPIRHVVRGILIDGTGDPKRFRPRWAVMHLCQRHTGFHLEWGNLIYHPVVRLWFWNDPRVPSALAEILEEQTLPLLRSINTLDDFLAIAGGPQFWISFSSFTPGRVVIDVARGDLESARKLVPELVSDRYMWAGLAHPQGVVKTFCPLIEADDRPGLVKLLHECEAFTVKQLGIEKIWEPTPFPLEMQGDLDRSE